MTPFDDFFRHNYRRMVGYCSAFFNESDVEEEVASVIYACYDEYAAKIESAGREATMRAWMNRRVLLNLRSRYRNHDIARTEQLETYEQLTFDDPESILELKQTLPPVHPILIDYEPYGGAASARGENTSADKTRFCRERKKFMEAFR